MTALFLGTASTAQYVIKHAEVLVARVWPIETELPAWLSALHADVALATLPADACPQLEAHLGEVLVFVRGALAERIAAPSTLADLFVMMNDRLRAEWEREATARVNRCIVAAARPRAKRGSPRTSPPRSPFELLGLPGTASAREVKKRFKDLAFTNSPDRVASLDPCIVEFATERMKVLEEAQRSALALLRRE